jgi:hypothetical protein
MFESTSCELLAGGDGCEESTYGWIAGIIVPGIMAAGGVIWAFINGKI